MSSSYKKIYEVVKQIPPGFVATYGQVAKLAGLPHQARLVGYALNALKDNDIPWHRVINRRGEISKRATGVYESLQKEMLEDEGIIFSPDNKVPLEKYRWESKGSVSIDLSNSPPSSLPPSRGKEC